MQLLFFPLDWTELWPWYFFFFLWDWPIKKQLRNTIIKESFCLYFSFYKGWWGQGSRSVFASLVMASDRTWSVHPFKHIKVHLITEALQKYSSLRLPLERLFIFKWKLAYLDKKRQADRFLMPRCIICCLLLDLIEASKDSVYCQIMHL